MQGLWQSIFFFFRFNSTRRCWSGEAPSAKVCCFAIARRIISSRQAIHWERQHCPIPLSVLCWTPFIYALEGTPILNAVVRNKFDLATYSSSWSHKSSLAQDWPAIPLRKLRLVMFSIAWLSPFWTSFLIQKHTICFAFSNEYRERPKLYHEWQIDAQQSSTNELKLYNGIAMRISRYCVVQSRRMPSHLVFSYQISSWSTRHRCLNFNHTDFEITTPARSSDFLGQQPIVARNLNTVSNLLNGIGLYWTYGVSCKRRAVSKRKGNSDETVRL